MKWQGLGGIASKKYICGYCDNKVASDRGYNTDLGSNSFISICPYCQKPSYFSPQYDQIPGIAAGNDVDSLPDDIDSLYREARNCVAVSAFTASVLTCRKLLMNIAVAQEAEAGKSFLFYVDYLANEGYVPPNGRGWVDHIRKKGNEANHEIALMSHEDAVELISFAEMLMKFIYEFPAKIPLPPS